MKVSNIFVALITVGLSQMVSGQRQTQKSQKRTCSSIVQRKEIRAMTQAELNRYVSAVKRLRQSSNNDGFTSSSNLHLSHVPEAHGVPAFFPWHRYFLRKYERSLQEVDAKVVLPYWDWTLDSQAPERSPVFKPEFFGGNGDTRSGNCISTGPFANWQVKIPQPHCLKRDYNGGNTISSLYSGEAIERILQTSRTFDEFRRTIEGGPHGSVHNGIGGNKGDFSTMYSPNDPLFYAHHTFVDMLWSEWQLRNPQLANSYNGRDQNGREVSTIDIMKPFNIRVGQVMKTQSLCYTYPRWKVNLPSKFSTMGRQSRANRLFRRQGLFGNIMGGSPRGSIMGQSLDFLNQVREELRELMVSPFDRQIRGKIRSPLPLPDAYIQRNHLNRTDIRRFEMTMMTFVGGLNSLEGFVPRVDIY